MGRPGASSDSPGTARRRTQLWFVQLCAALCAAAPVSHSLVVVSSDSVQRGHSTILPCWLNPPQNAEELEVRWYRGDRYDTPIMLYQAKESTFKDASYVGRVSFGLKDAASGGLKTGDVSLKLENVTVADAGGYTCYVTSNRLYDSSTSNLRVTEMGSPPLVTPVWKGGMVNVSCESDGWYPQPVLRWSDLKQDLTSKNTVHSKGSSGLHSVHSWLLLPSSTEVSCSVGLPNKEATEARLRLEKPPSPEIETVSSLGGWVAFALLLLLTAVAALLYFLYFKKKAKNNKPERDRTGENETLLPKEVVTPTPLSDAKQYHVNIQLEDTNNPWVTIKDSKLRDANKEHYPDGQSVTCLTAVKGTPGFSCGQSYWEVSLGGEHVDLKQSWWVGVTSVTETLQELKVSPNTSNGFWFLSSSPDRADHIQFSIEPMVSLRVHEKPQTLGVHLNYDSGELSFYNVGDRSLIGSLKAEFQGEVFPFFNPGKGDIAPMEILPVRDMGNVSKGDKAPMEILPVRDMGNVSKGDKAPMEILPVRDMENVSKGDKAPMEILPVRDMENVSNLTA